MVLVANGSDFDIDEVLRGEIIKQNPFAFNAPPSDSQLIPIKELKVENLNQAHKVVIDENNHEISYNELFGRKIPKEEQIDVENSPFDILEPSAEELNSFQEAEQLPLPNNDSPQEVAQIENTDNSFPENKIPVKKSSNDSNNDEEPDNSSMAFDETFLSNLSNLKQTLLSENQDSVGLGLFYQTRTGSPGLDALDNFVLPSVDANLFFGLSHHLYGHINFINLNSGTVAHADIQRYGQKLGGNTETVSALGEAMIGYQYKSDQNSFTVEFGSLPTPSLVPVKRYVWRVEYITNFDNITLNVAHTAKSIKDSMLSRIGDTFKYVEKTGDKNNTANLEEKTASWGQVVKKGFEVGLKYKQENQVFAGNFNYYNIGGYRVIDNEEISLAFLYLRLLQLENFQSFMVGPIFLYDNYTFNSGYFTIADDFKGHGGYFSPKNFLLFGLYFDMAQIINPEFFWKLKGNFGFMTFISGRDLLDEESTDTTVNGFGYDLKAFVGYKLDHSIQILGGMGYQSSGPFQSLFMGITALYYFGENKSNEIGDLLYSNTLGEMAK